MRDFSTEVRGMVEVSVLLSHNGRAHAKRVTELASQVGITLPHGHEDIDAYLNSIEEERGLILDIMKEYPTEQVATTVSQAMLSASALLVGYGDEKDQEIMDDWAMLVFLLGFVPVGLVAEHGVAKLLGEERMEQMRGITSHNLRVTEKWQRENIRKQVDGVLYGTLIEEVVV